MGFWGGVPVFFDTVFYLLLPLARAMRRRARKDYLLYVMAIIVGATMAHSLVPPTPGPLFVAEALSVPIGLMMIAGTIVGLGSALVGYSYARWANGRWPIELPTATDGQASSLEEGSLVANGGPPPLWLSLLPILLPVVLLGTATGVEMTGGVLPGWLEPWGNKNMALGLSAVVGLWLLYRYGDARQSASSHVQQALLGAGSIVLITAAGGAFGHVLRQTGLALSVEQRFSMDQAGMTLLLIAFAFTALVRIAQGSATVAMITTVGIIAPLIGRGSLPYHPLYVALAIGVGSKPIPWMNDSGFWVVSRMSGLSEAQTLRTFSVALTLMGIAGLVLTLLAAWLLPLA